MLLSKLKPSALIKRYKERFQRVFKYLKTLKEPINKVGVYFASFMFYNGENPITKKMPLRYFKTGTIR